MPIYMDRHDVSESVTAEMVAQMHKEDLKIQHEFECRGLTYWFDGKRGTAFCLVEAPDAQAIQKMHAYAHGEVPHAIIEVDANIVESFLGRIEDPEKSQNTELNIINDPAFRTIMVVDIKRIYRKRQDHHQTSKPLEDYNKANIEIFNTFEGRIVKQNEEYFLVSFKSVTKAVLCAIRVQAKFKEYAHEIENTELQIIIGLSSGVPVIKDKSFFEETVQTAERICNITDNGIIVTSQVKDLYKSENSNVFVDGEIVLALTFDDEKFINYLMDYTEKSWRNTELQVEDFGKALGYSKSQLYRKMIALTGKSPNIFLKEYRLHRALKLLIKHSDNISEVAFDTGFNSPSYFTKCFNKRYGLGPSEYMNLMYA